MNKGRLYRYAFQWVSLATVLVGIITFGFIYPRWEMAFAYWYAQRQIRRKMREETRHVVD